MCCQLLAKLALHLRLVGRPFGHHGDECWCVTGGLLVHNLTGRLTWTISTCCWQLRLSSGSVTSLLKQLWIFICVGDTSACLVRWLVHLVRCCCVGKNARTACTHQILPLRSCSKVYVQFLSTRASRSQVFCARANFRSPISGAVQRERVRGCFLEGV